MSIGSPGSERQLINLAPGQVSATSTDAVNGSQLYQLQQGDQQYTDSRFNSLDKTMRPGLAAAAALQTVAA
ncbi:hypothetical protein [Paraburkholderia sediminicola]|uniref:hypothetical protein n=1 Tax=Paraburkholderia sediminicola TaxID=458836 RepID=UPI0038BCE89B